MSQGPSEEPAGRRGVSLLGQQHVDDLPVLVDRPVQVSPPAGDLDVGLIDEPPVAGGVPQRAGGVGEQRRESLHPAVHRHVVRPDTALGQQLLDIPVGQPVAEIPADSDRDHLGREPEAGKRGPVDVGTGGSRSTHSPSFLSRGPGRRRRARRTQQTLSGGMPKWASGIGEQRREPLHPPVHSHVVHPDTALGQHLRDVPIGQPIPEVPADRDRDHLRREPEPGKRRALDWGTAWCRSWSA
jgi:hypothetical protein